MYPGTLSGPDSTTPPNSVPIPYGRGHVELELTGGFRYRFLAGRDQPAVSNLLEAVAGALTQPVGAPRIAESVRRTDRVVIVVNDITRPGPSGLMVREIARELAIAGVPDRQVTVLVATGTHRPNTRLELAGMLGEEVLDRFAVVNHDCRDDAGLVRLGTTPGGTPVVVNRIYEEADYRVLTGVITPHQAAGFS
ncbi:MAG: lactate racemase domain-containing protein, partial [Eubacteriales bacterium]